MESSDPRSEGEILAHVVPGHTLITLGGVTYAAREPEFPRAQALMLLQGRYGDLEKDKKISDVERMAAINAITVEMVKGFSAEIDADWERICQTATMEELLWAVEIIGVVLNRPFVRRAQAVASNQSRKARRSSGAKS